MKPDRIRARAEELVELINRYGVAQRKMVVEDFIEDVLKEQRTLCIDCDEPSGEFAHRCEECLAHVEGWEKE